MRKINYLAATLALIIAADAFFATAHAAAPPGNIVRMNPFVSTAKTGYVPMGDAATAASVYAKAQSFSNIASAPVSGWMAAAADAKALDPNAPTAGFQGVTLPHAWGADPIRVFRAAFTMPDTVNGFAIRGGAVSLWFAGKGTLDVYINGKRIKSFAGSGELDITGKIKPGDTVTLGVKVTEMTGHGKLEEVSLRSAELDQIRTPVGRILTQLETARLLLEQLPGKQTKMIEAVIAAGRELDALKGATDIAAVSAALDRIEALLAPMETLTARFPVFNAGPFLQNVKQDEITVVWETRAPAPSAVYYGRDALDTVVSDPTPVTFHKVTLKGLAPETAYKYLAVSADQAAPESTFRTAVKRDTPFSFVAWGDNQSNPQISEPLADLMIPLKPDIAVNVGDVVGNGSDYTAWARELFYPMRRLFINTPYFTAIGNHEYTGISCGTPVKWFESYMALPQPPNYYYAFTYGNARFIMLNQQQDMGCPGVNPGTAQYEWLLKELESPEYKAADFRFMFMHKPPYSNCWAGGYYDGEAAARAHLVPLIEKYGVDIVFSGHTHDYERGQWPRPGGPYYIITGGGGGSLDDTVYKEWPQMQLHHFAHHFSHVSINGRTLKFQAVDKNGNVIDSFEIKKN